MRRKMTIEQAITLLWKQYEKSKKSPYIKNPLAWALYHTWKMADKEWQDKQ